MSPSKKVWTPSLIVVELQCLCLLLYGNPWASPQVFWLSRYRGRPWPCIFQYRLNIGTTLLALLWNAQKQWCTHLLFWIHCPWQTLVLGTTSVWTYFSDHWYSYMILLIPYSYLCFVEVVYKKRSCLINILAEQSISSIYKHHTLMVRKLIER